MLVAIGMVGCVPQPGYEWQRLGSGWDAQVLVTCDGEQSECYMGAREACRYGFDVLSTDGSSQLKTDRNVLTGKATGVRTEYSGTLLVQCRRPRAQ